MPEAGLRLAQRLRSAAALAPMLFDENDPPAAAEARKNVASPAARSPKARSRDDSKRTEDGLPVRGFQTLLKDLAALTTNEARVGEQTLPMLATPTPVQQRALQLLQVSGGV